MPNENNNNNNKKEKNKQKRKDTITIALPRHLKELVKGRIETFDFSYFVRTAIKELLAELQAIEDLTGEIFVSKDLNTENTEKKMELRIASVSGLSKELNGEGSFLDSINRCVNNQILACSRSEFVRFAVFLKYFKDLRGESLFTPKSKMEKDILESNLSIGEKLLVFLRKYFIDIDKNNFFTITSLVTLFLSQEDLWSQEEYLKPKLHKQASLFVNKLLKQGLIEKFTNRTYRTLQKIVLSPEEMI